MVFSDVVAIGDVEQSQNSASSFVSWKTKSVSAWARRIFQKIIVSIPLHPFRGEIGLYTLLKVLR
jgi:hypothetical protein